MRGAEPRGGAGSGARAKAPSRRADSRGNRVRPAGRSAAGARRGEPDPPWAEWEERGLRCYSGRCARAGPRPSRRAVPDSRPGFHSPAGSRVPSLRCARGRPRSTCCRPNAARTRSPTRSPRHYFGLRNVDPAGRPGQTGRRRGGGRGQLVGVAGAGEPQPLHGLLLPGEREMTAPWCPGPPPADMAGPQGAVTVPSREVR